MITTKVFDPESMTGYYFAGFKSGKMEVTEDFSEAVDVTNFMVEEFNSIMLACRRQGLVYIVSNRAMFAVK